MLIRARAPLRLGLAGGGTDLSPYCERFGGAVLNATIDLYAYATLEPLPGAQVCFVAKDGEFEETLSADPQGMSIDGSAILHRAVYRRISRQFLGGKPYPCRLTTYCEAPPGSGLGSSSTMVVAMVKAFVEALSLPLGEYDIARLAFDIERIDARLQGGRQDQYAAAFGGFNFMEFYSDERAIVNPLRIKNWILSELEACILLFYTGVSRSSADIIAEQTQNISSSGSKSTEAMHQLKADAFVMKEAVLKGDFQAFATVLNKSWAAKKQTAASISNFEIDHLFDVAMNAGAIAGKVSGAGGGGFITFVVDPLARMNVIRHLAREDGQVMTCSFTKRGTRGLENQLMSYIRNEVAKTVEVMQAILADTALLNTVERVGEVCAKSIAGDGKIMFCGNGGSAGDSQHLAAELVGKLVFDRPGMSGLALTVDTSTLTAVGNDFGYEFIFSRQVESLGRPGDVLVGISTSGRSKNVVKAMEAARAQRIVTVAMTGANRGPMAELADHWIAVPHTETQKIQEGHIVLGHIFCALIEETIHGKRRSA